MLDADAFQRWLTKSNPRIEVIPGLHSGRVLAGALADAEVRPGQSVRAGGYGEDRSNYTQALFAPAGEEPRTVHLGLDIFAPHGTDVFAPLASRVHSAARA